MRIRITRNFESADSVEALRGQMETVLKEIEDQLAIYPDIFVIDKKTGVPKNAERGAIIIDATESKPKIGVWTGKAINFGE